MRTKLLPITLITLIALLLLAACASAASNAPEPSSEGGFGGSDSAFRGEIAPGAPMEMEAMEESFDTSVEGQSSERLVIKNADMSIAVDSPADTMNEIIGMAERMGGFVVSSQLYKTASESGTEFPRARITIRVPAESLNAALEEIKGGAGEVLFENTSGEDVTQQYTDLQSRLTNLEQTEAQLREIMEDANRTEDVLQVFNELSRVREQIEVIKGQIQYFEQSAALSAISVDIQTEEAIEPLSIGSWEPVGVARDAVQALLNAVQFLANAAIWIFLFLLPVGLVLILPILLIVFVFRRLMRRRKANQPAAQPDAPAQE
jgi:hypothetical protein